MCHSRFASARLRFSAHYLCMRLCSVLHRIFGCAHVLLPARDPLLEALLLSTARVLRLLCLLERFVLCLLRAPHAAAEGVFNMAPQDFLRSLPGVHPHNYRKLMNSVTNLQELASCSQERLAGILGAQNGRLLHEFLHREV